MYWGGGSPSRKLFPSARSDPKSAWRGSTRFASLPPASKHMVAENPEVEPLFCTCYGPFFPLLRLPFSSSFDFFCRFSLLVGRLPFGPFHGIASKPRQHSPRLLDITRYVPRSRWRLHGRPTFFDSVPPIHKVCHSHSSTFLSFHWQWSTLRDREREREP